ncbi:uncharacterized protein LAJ45_00096 [Morchella importuna]|uniref:uncharacterized protein n=1 Tax=Morchella importuna TaxID=1174673 RepID=UPI001E8EEAD1|nr:uncharacterized protein LAJ45_00096 [Morchella importuna]KAH8155087.1 hypothetical protein LAJ45_00096 [Morchella importuna]
MVFIPLTALLSSLLLSSFAHAAPQGLDTGAGTPATDPPAGVDISEIPPAPVGSTPVSAIEDAFKSLRAAKHADTFSTLAAVKTTRNELLEKKTCAPVIVIFARGTTEPGNVGDDVGPYFFDALAALKPGKVAVQGVNNYPADVWGYLGGGSDTGAADMAASVAKAATQCPGSKIVLSGFSQGAQVVHKAAKRIPSALYANVGAIVLFGDPNNGDSFPGSLNANVKTFCHFGDLICLGWPVPLPPHLNYEDDAGAAAQFVVGRIAV